jgi:type IV pilus assembly protein PilX
MPKRVKKREPTGRRQRGAALVVGLIFLAMLSLMGVAAYMVANQEERMSGNTRDRIRAFEAAESSLRDCESLLGGFGTLPTFNGTNGMHQAPAFGQRQIFEQYDDDSDGTPNQWKGQNGGSVRVIPQVGGAPAIPDVALQPRCIVERMDDIEVRKRDAELSVPKEVAIETIFRITAIGYGINPGTNVTLQTMFRR